ncbi:MAG: hypothetical protein ACLPSH_17255 [Vulcanimicrobiaceae bacterium]
MPPVCAALCVAAVLAFPRVASAQGLVPPPVTINSCRPMLINNFVQPSPIPSLGGMPLTMQSCGIAIELVNESNVTADLVNFLSYPIVVR